MVQGKIRFGLPGRPMFDALDPRAFLKPTPLWRLRLTRQHGVIQARNKMMPSRTIRLLLFTLLPIALVADVSGTWTGTVAADRPGGDVQPAFLILTEKNGRLTGTAGPSENDQRAIENGRVEGDRIRFEMTVAQQTMSFDLRMTQNRLSGSVSGADPSGGTEHFTLRAERR